jgi:hypothetical protein
MRTCPPAEAATELNRYISADQKICQPIVAVRRGDLFPVNLSHFVRLHGQGVEERGRQVYLLTT